jgi:hypothetical protein
LRVVTSKRKIERQVGGSDPQPGDRVRAID